MFIELGALAGVARSGSVGVTDTPPGETLGAGAVSIGGSPPPWMTTLAGPLGGGGGVGDGDGNGTGTGMTTTPRGGGTIGVGLVVGRMVGGGGSGAGAGGGRDVERMPTPGAGGGGGGGGVGVLRVPISVGTHLATLKVDGCGDHFAILCVGDATA